jgi:uncharacterized protein (DUF2267 family)
MSTTGLATFDETTQKTNIWLKEIGRTLDCDRQLSYQALRAVLHCPRDRLIVDEAAHFGDQLPMLGRASTTRRGDRQENRRRFTRARNSSPGLPQISRKRR